ncbi:hypothetical protein [Tissierella sp.]|uniref:hypothetical protein n=1 Tax=Tissierella sp. TaxID=41274 RepID=UPI00285527AB|nr:hypothetical protein [Tissierella sp.]MDR7857562.1 hypothetical protein [Tissierella sp.]
MDERFYDLMEKLYLEMQSTRTELKAEIQGVRTELKAEIQELRDTMATKADLQELRDTMATKEDFELAVEELKTEIQVVHDEVKELRNDFNVVEMVTSKNSLDISKLKICREN